MDLQGERSLSTEMNFGPLYLVISCFVIERFEKSLRGGGIFYFLAKRGGHAFGLFGKLGGGHLPPTYKGCDATALSLFQTSVTPWYRYMI